MPDIIANMGVGRPKADIKAEQVEELAARLWNVEQIAAFFKVQPITIRRNFDQELLRGKEAGRSKLIDAMWKRIAEGSDRMLEHAMNRFLGQIKQDIVIDHCGSIEVKSKEEVDKEIARLDAIADVSR